MTRIALVQEDLDPLDEVVRQLHHAGHTAQVVATWPALEPVQAAWAPRIVVCGEQATGGDALAQVARLRLREPDLGLIVRVRSIRAADRLAAWRHGADQVLSGPLHADELVLAVRNLARRVEPELRAGWTLDLSRLVLTAPGGGEAPLNAAEAAVLQAIARATHRRCPRPELAAALGEDWRHYDERRLEALMSRLRRKLNEASGREAPLRALRGQGYSFGEPLVLR